MRPVLIGFEGIDGVGKTTQCRLLSNWLSERGLKNIIIKEPGTTSLGSLLRDVLVNRTHGILSPFTEMLLFEADRSHTYETVILPSLEQGISVIKDRSVFGTLAYQGYAAGVDLDLIRLVTSKATKGRRADWSFVLDLSISTADERLRGRDTKTDHFEMAGFDRKEKIRQAYLREAERNRDWCTVIDASGTTDQIASQVFAKMDELLAISRAG